MAQAQVSEEIFSVDLKALAFYWSGQYTLLWEPPPGYHGLIRPGSQGKAKNGSGPDRSTRTGDGGAQCGGGSSGKGQ